MLNKNFVYSKGCKGLGQPTQNDTEVILRYLFEDCALDTDRRELRCRTDLVAVQPQVFDLLAYLIWNRNQVVTKDDLLRVVWNRRVPLRVGCHNPDQCGSNCYWRQWSRVLKRLIRTLPRKGFRFVGEVNEEQAPLGNAARATSPEFSIRVS